MPHQNIETAQLGETFVRLGGVGFQLIGHATSEALNTSLRPINDLAVSSAVEGLPIDGILEVLGAYSKRYRELKNTHAVIQKDDDLFEEAFGVRPASDVRAHRLSGGTIFEVDQGDYRTVLIRRSIDVEKAEAKAKKTVGIAYGELPVGFAGSMMPVGLQARQMVEKSAATLYPSRGRPISGLNVDNLETIELNFRTPDKKKETVTIQPIAGQMMITKNHGSKTAITQKSKGSKLKITAGPYSVKSDGTELTVSLRNFSDDQPTHVNITNILNPAYVSPGGERVRRHELQHLINSLYRPPIYSQATMEKYKKRIAERRPLSYRTPEAFVKAASREVIYSLMGESIRDEFLAKIAGGTPLGSIVDVLASQVEQKGISYDYLTDNEVTIEALLKDTAEQFPTVTLKDIRAEVIRTYRPQLKRVADTIHKRAHESPYLHKLSNDELIALLAPHPFRRWRVVLFAVERYAEAVGPGRQDLFKLATAT